MLDIALWRRPVCDPDRVVSDGNNPGRTRFTGQIIRSGKHGQYVIPREAVEGMVEQLQERPLPVQIEHDPSERPVGRVIDARLVELPDGEVALEADMELFPDKVEAMLFPMARLYEILGQLPAVDPEEGPLHLQIDQRSYAANDLEELRAAAAAVGSVTTSDSQLRFSAVPDALLIIALGTPAAAMFWFTKGFFTKAGEAAGESIGRELGDEAVRAYRSFKSHLREMVANRRRPKDRPPITLLTLELDKPGGGKVEVEGSTHADDERLDAFLDAGLELFAVAQIYLRIAPDPERLAKMHFVHAERGWRYEYGLDTEAEPVMVLALSDEQIRRRLGGCAQRCGAAAGGGRVPVAGQYVIRRRAWGPATPEPPALPTPGVRLGQRWWS